MDPLSIAGISLAACRKDDIKAALNQAEVLQELLELLKSSTSKFTPGHAQHTLAIQSILSKCQTEIDSLKKLISELTRHGFKSSSMRRDLKQKLAFPFQKKDIIRLEQRIDRLNGLLMTALQSLGVETASSMTTLMSQINQISKTTDNSVRTIGINLRRMMPQISSIEGSNVGIKDIVE
ncbi:hypothetical protein F5B20DRAFT_585590 [Whalleya microplaca]|nr:hypothetical protein F5B20DRAFT_585590 [Whalleya microplaca]